jgi:predicted Zn-dependent protease
MGLIKQAEGFYRQALEKNAEDFILLAQAADFFRHMDQQEKAEPYLVALLQPASGAPAESVVRARRYLAFVLAAKGKGNQKKALDLIDGNLKSHPNNLADVRARAFLQATQPALRRQAIRVFEDTRKRQPLSADEQLQLAQLLDAAGDQRGTREQIDALLTAQPENPQFLAFFIRFLIEAEDTTQAERQIQKLDRLEPDSPRTLELKARLKGLQ